MSRPSLLFALCRSGSKITIAFLVRMISAFKEGLRLNSGSSTLSEVEGRPFCA